MCSKRTKGKMTAVERLAFLQDRLNRRIMSGDTDVDDLRFDIEQARIDADLEKLKIEGDENA